jgi:hypothetical protein
METERRINEAIEEGIIDNNEFQEYEALIQIENGEHI